MIDPYAHPPAPSPRPRRDGVQLVLLLLLGVIAGASVTRWWYDNRPPAERTVVPRGSLAEDERSTVKLFQAVSPSVVYITTFNERVGFGSAAPYAVPRGTGTGFVWDDRGHIVTNFHVIGGDVDGAWVTFSDHTAYRAVLVGHSVSHDLAVLRVDAPRDRLPPIPIGTSADLLVGQKVFAIGNPFGLDQTLTTGIVSALGRSIQSLSNVTIGDVIQTDAAINPGNSGGPLLDSAGRLIGVSTAISSPSGASAGIGFAVPVDTVNRIVPQLIRTGGATPAPTGIVLDERLSAMARRQLGIDGVMIREVVPGSPADAASLRGASRQAGGIVPGDVIQAVDGRPVRSVGDFDAILALRDPGQTINLTILRGQQRLTVPLALEPDLK